jgi:hypothetical protein
LTSDSAMVAAEFSGSGYNSTGASHGHE